MTKCDISVPYSPLQKKKNQKKKPKQKKNQRIFFFFVQVYQDDDFDVNRGIHLLVLNQATVSSQIFNLPIHINSMYRVK